MIFQGGIQVNVVPAEMTAYFDVRITPTADLKEMDRMIQQWCTEAGPGLKIEYLQRMEEQTLTSTQSGNVWWDAFSSELNSM